MTTTPVIFLAAGLFSATALAAVTLGGGPPRTDQGGEAHTVEQRKVTALQHIEERIANSLLEKSCVQTAQTDDALRACHEQYRPPKQAAERKRVGQ